jgi:hypothetical protein
LELISNERKQTELPVTKAHWKIPAVCAHPDVSVECLDFVELFKASGTVFR